MDDVSEREEELCTNAAMRGDTSRDALPKDDGKRSNVELTDGLRGGDMTSGPGVDQLLYPESKEWS